MATTPTPIGYTDVNYQIQKLRGQNLIIEDEPEAIRLLSQCGYSNLIKSYRDPYIITTGSGISYRNDVTFQQVASLYAFDKNLRRAVISSMLDLEEHVKAAAAEIVGKYIGTDSAVYLDKRHYRNKRVRNSHFDLAHVLKNLKGVLSSDKDPIHHCMVTHGSVPPWILFNGVYFSTIVNLIVQFPIPLQDQLALELFDPAYVGASGQGLRFLMNDSLFLALEYRNLAAHGGRVYNYSAKANLRFNDIWPGTTATAPIGFSKLLLVLSRFKYSDPYNVLVSVLNEEVNRHCQSYPLDTTFLGQTLNINIMSRQIVYVTNKSKKYHTLPFCSGIRNPIKMSLEDAKAHGYSPCKRCSN